MINLFDSKGYVGGLSSATETQEQRYYRVGDNVTIMMVKAA